MTDKNVSVLTSGSYTGSQTVREFEVTDLNVEDGKLNGTAVGSVEKEGTGVVDKVRLSFTDVPFEGVGGPVEYIDLGEMSGGGSEMITGQTWSRFIGGGSFKNENGPCSLYDLVGDRTIIGLSISNPTWQDDVRGGNVIGLVGFFATGNSIPGRPGVDKNILHIFSKEEKQAAGGGTISAIYYPESDLGKGKLIRCHLYAICV